MTSTVKNSLTRFGLLRHAPTRWNRDRRLQGQSDSPLTRQGRQIAGQWGVQLKAMAWDRIVASDLGRTAATAALVNAEIGAPIFHDARLREQDWGLWSGLTLAKLEHSFHDRLQSQVQAGWEFRPPQGESRSQVRDRAREALEDAAVKWRGETILIVTHEGVIKCLIYHLCGRKFLPEEPPIIRSGHLHWLICTGPSMRIEQINALRLTPAP